MNVPHTELLNTSGAQTLALARLLHAQLAGRGQPLGGMGPAVAPARHTPQKEAASAKAWTKPEDQLIVDMMRAKFEKRTPEHTYSSIGRITGRSANAVKCRWQNKLCVVCSRTAHPLCLSLLMLAFHLCQEIRGGFQDER